MSNDGRVKHYMLKHLCRTLHFSWCTEIFMKKFMCGEGSGQFLF